MKCQEFKKNNISHRKGAGFTLLELLIVVGIIALLAALAVPALQDFQNSSNLENSAEELIDTLRLARQKTIASDRASSWGVYFSTSTLPHQYTLFKGADYASRDTAFDEIKKLPKSVEIYQIDFSDGNKEVVFKRITGAVFQFGKIYLRLKNNAIETRTISIGNLGQIWAE